MNTAFDLLIAIITLTFAILMGVLPAKAARRKQDVNSAYPAFPFLFPALVAVIAIQQFVDYPRLSNRGTNGLVMACCIFIAVFQLWAARRRKTPKPYRTPSAVTMLFGILAVVFAFLTFR